MPSIQSVTVGATNLAGTITCSVPVNAGDGLLMLAAIHIEAAGDDCTAMTRDGQSLVEDDVVAATSWSRAELWALVNPNLGTNTLTATVAGPGADRARLVVWVIEDADPITPLRATVKAGGDSAASSSLNAPAVQATDLIIDLLTLDSTGHSPAVGANQTSEYSTNWVTSFELAGSSQLGSDGAAMSWTWTTACPYSHIAVAVVHTADVMQELRPDADIDATGWATAPLWSKIEEAAADGTVVTGVAS